MLRALPFRILQCEHSRVLDPVVEGLLAVPKVRHEHLQEIYFLEKQERELHLHPILLKLPCRARSLLAEIGPLLFLTSPIMV